MAEVVGLHQGEALVFANKGIAVEVNGDDTFEEDDMRTGRKLAPCFKNLSMTCQIYERERNLMKDKKT